MGKKLDALLGRTFKFRASKFKPILNLAISRLAVLENQRQARCKQARSDVLQLLQLDQHERALLRVEQVIKEQNMLDVYDMIEGYCNLLIERIYLIEQERECPEELKEAASCLIYAASRCGDFPELQEIRAVLTSRFGKDFAARAIELKNNCAVHLQMITKLSTRTPGLEKKMQVLKEIASENGIVLRLDEVSSVSVEEQRNFPNQNQPDPDVKIEDNLHILPEGVKDNELSDSFKSRQKYKDVADAAQAAFESAAYAAAAARAAVELSRSESHDPDDQNSPRTPSKNVSNTHESFKAMPQFKGKEILLENQGEEFNRRTEELQKPKYGSSSNSGEVTLEDNSVSMDTVGEADPFEKDLVFDESDDETTNKQNSSQFTIQESPRFHTNIEVGSGSRHLMSNAVAGLKIQNPPHLDLEKKPFSVRTGRVRGY